MNEEEAFTFSASAVSTWRECPRKLGYRYIDAVETESGKAAALGTEVHSQLENWLAKKTVPTHEVAKRLLQLLPSPSHPSLLTEYEFRLLFPIGVARGYIDVLIPRPVIKYLPKGPWSPERAMVLDHKTTSNLDYAKSTKDLETDPQAVLYGLAARLERSRRTGEKPSSIKEVDLLWNYVTTKGPKATRKVHLKQTLPILEEGVGQVLATANEIGAGVAHGITDDLPYDLRVCERYGGCPHKKICKAYQHFLIAGTGPDLLDALPTVPSTKSMPSALLARLAATSSKAPKADLIDPVAKTQAQTETTPPPETVSSPALKPSPEPVLTQPDVSGTLVPLVPGTSPIVPPDAQKNVTPDDPKPIGKKKPGRPAGSKNAPKEPEVLDVAEVESSVDDQPVHELVDSLKKRAALALKNNDLTRAYKFLTAAKALME